MATNTYPPLVEYNNKKDFMTLMSTLFEKIDALASDDKINTEEYRQMADICKQMYNIKEQVRTQVVYVEIQRAVQRKPPKPPKAEQEKLEAKSHTTCQFCDKRIHKKWLKSHQETSATCLRVRQTKLNVNVLTKENDNDATSKPLYAKIQVMNLSLAKRHYQSGKLCSNELENRMFAPITTIVEEEKEREVLEVIGQDADGNDMVETKLDGEGNPVVEKYIKKTHITESVRDVMIRWWSEVRPIGKYIKSIEWKKSPEARIADCDNTGLNIKCQNAIFTEYNRASWKMFLAVKVKKVKKAPVKKLIVVDDEDDEELAMMAQEDKDAPAPEPVEEVKKWGVGEGILNQHFYKTYLRSNIPNKWQKVLDKDLKDEDDDFVEYKVVGIKDKSNSQVEYTELWFLESSKGCCPVLVRNINTSSGYAMCRCGMDREYDNEEEEQEYSNLTEEQILGLCMDDAKQKSVVKNLINNGL